MGTVATTVNANPLIWPSTTLIDRSPLTGHLFTMVKATAADTYELRRSTDGGANWSTVTSVVRANVQEIGSLLIPSDGMIYWCFRTAESGQDRVYFQRFYLGPPLQTGPQVLVASAANGGVAGSVYSGVDIQSAMSATTRYVVVAMGTTVGTTHGVVLVGATITSRGQHAASNVMLTGTRWWFATGSGRITPSMEIEHVGNSKTGFPAHLWVTWGRTDVYVAKLSYSNGAWAGPTSPVRINPVTLAAQDSIAGRWDGQRFLVAAPDPTATDRVQVLERNRANSRTTTRQTPAHPTGNVRNCSLSYDAKTGNIRVYAVGTSSAVLHFVDFNRAAGTWTAWAQVTATAILGATGNNYSVRRSTAGNARYDVLTAHATPTPNTIVSTHQVVAYAPNTPTWDTVAIGVDNGAAANVSAALNLQWTFTDPDPVDVQSAWALSRQIGVGAIQYLRASDSTWQAAEVKNVGMSVARSLPAGWGLTSDPPHAYKVKVWDSTDNGSAYSDAFVVLPSGKVNPVITAPTPAQVITQDAVTVTWTAAEQTAFRVQLKVFTAVVYDSGWRAGTATTFVPDLELADGFGYTAVVQTRNLEGLVSDEVQVSFTVDYLEPPTASLTATPLPALGVIRVAVSNPAPVGSQPAVSSQDVYRRPLVNPLLFTADFESADMSAWGAPTAGTAVRSNVRAKSGSWSYELTADVGLASYVETVKLPCTAGVTYFLDMWSAGSSATREQFAQLRWYDAGGVSVGADNGFSKPPPAADTFDFRWVAATAPPTATQMTLCAVLALPAAGAKLWVDDVRVRVNDLNNGVRIAAGLPTGATVDDWRAVSGVAYEYRAQTRSVIGTTVGGVWTA